MVNNEEICDKTKALILFELSSIEKNINDEMPGLEQQRWGRVGVGWSAA